MPDASGIEPAFDGRGRVPFFHKADTHALIEDVSSLGSVVIWVGAGATIDRTGHDWNSLMNALLPDAYSPVARQLAARWLREAAGASAVQETIMQRDAPAKLNALHVKLSGLLYGAGEYFGGALVRAVGEFAIALKMAGRRVIIVSPNYDTYLRLEIERLLQQRSLLLEVEEIDWTVPSRLSSGNRLPKTISRALDPAVGLSIVHLHGIVTGPQDSRTASGDLVFSESSYESSAKRSDSLLAPLLSSCDLLIVGAGMSDPPLLRNLIKTTAKRNSIGLKTWVMLTHQGIIGSQEVSEVDVEQVEAIVRARLQHFGGNTSAIFSDFYFQNAQFLIEAAIATTLGEPYATSDQRYGKRLVDWWQGWQAASASVKVRNADLSEAKTTLPKVARALNKPAAEGLNIEVWLRWNPDSEERLLRRWITTAADGYASVGSFKEDESARIAIGDGLDNPSRVAQVFCQGRQLLFDNVEGDAWVGAVLTFDSQQYGDRPLPVGVIVIRGSRMEWSTRLSAKTQANSISSALDLLSNHYGLRLIQRH